METGNNYVTRASLMTRTSLRPFSYEERKRYAQKAGAVVVADPALGTPAAEAGLRRGDIIVAFNGQTVDEPGDLYAALHRRVIGQECELEYLREQKRQRTTVIPCERVTAKRGP